MTTSDLEKQLLQLPPTDKLRIIELLIKSLSGFFGKEPERGEESNHSELGETNRSLTLAPVEAEKPWPEFIQSLARAWADFPSLQEIRADIETDLPRENLGRFCGRSG